METCCCILFFANKVFSELFCLEIVIQLMWVPFLIKNNHTYILNSVQPMILFFHVANNIYGWGNYTHILKMWWKCQYAAYSVNGVLQWQNYILFSV